MLDACAKAGIMPCPPLTNTGPMTKTFSILLMTLLITGCAGDKTDAPAPAKKPVRLERHGDVRTDDYYWLRERENPEVIAYLEAENAYTADKLKPTKGLQKILFDEIKGRSKQDDQSAPFKQDDYFYYTRYVTGSEYPIYARKKGSLEADEEIMLDVNELAGDADYFAVRGFDVSPDHRIAAYGLDTTGRRFYDLYFLDLETGKLLPDRVEQVTNNFAWANDSQTIVYIRQHPDTLRAYQAYRHTLGTSADTLIYQEDDETNYLSVGTSLSRKFFYLTSEQTLSTEIRYLSADAPDEEPTIFLPREANHEYFVTDGEDRFYIVSNDNATNFRILETPLDNTDKSAWKELVAHRNDVLIDDIDVFKEFIAIEAVEKGIKQIEILARISGDTYRIDFGEDVYDAYSDDNYEFDTSVFRYTYESLTTPESTYDFDMVSRRHELIKEETVLGGFDRNNYRAERLFATARDGTQVPISILYQKDMQKNGQNPVFQYGYGSYGSSIEPYFDADVLSLVNRGFIFAIAHIRGGAEMGREWYYDGRQLNKKNTFTDFIDVTQFLIDNDYTSAEHVYAYGGSAGGLLVGAVINMAPQLYNGVNAAVPFVDVVTTMLDDTIPLTAGEWDEWGNPADKEYYDYMLSYSPYDNVRAMDYPNLLVTSGLHDSQVQYWEPTKWVAKLRAEKTGDSLLLLKTDMEAGHSGKTGRFRQIEDTALYMAFFLALEGIRE